MVVDEAPVLDRVFHSLADPTRRDILIRCGIEPLTVSSIAAGYPMSFAAVQKHVAVLEQAGLVAKERRGRERLVRARPDALQDARAALDRMEATWRARVERMRALLEDGTEDDRPEGDRT